MAMRFILTGYVDQAMAHAFYDKLEDGTFAGRIPVCQGVVAFGSTLRDCEEELRSTLEDWVLVGLRMGHPFAHCDRMSTGDKVASLNTTEAAKHVRR